MKTNLRVNLQFCSRVLLALGAISLVSCAGTGAPSGSFLTSYEGFTRESALDDASTYKGNLAGLKAYDRIYIEEVKVYPPAADVKESKQITSAELRQLEGAFRQAIASEVGDDLQIVGQRGPGTLSMRAAVSNLAPGNPLLFAASYAPYVGLATTAAGAVTGSNIGAGDAKIEAEMIDSVSRERYFAMIDRAAGSKLRPVEGLSRWGHVELAFKTWAKKFSKVLEREATAAAN